MLTELLKQKYTGDAAGNRYGIQTPPQQQQPRMSSLPSLPSAPAYQPEEFGGNWQALLGAKKKEKKERENLQKGLNAIKVRKSKLGEGKFVPADEMIIDLTNNNVPPQIALSIVGRIGQEDQNRQAQQKVMQEQQATQSSLNEILQMKERLKRPLTLIERNGIFEKNNVPSEMSEKINVRMDKEGDKDKAAKEEAEILRINKKLNDGRKLNFFEKKKIGYETPKPDMKKMLDANGNLTWHERDPGTNKWSDTGKGAKAPKEEKILTPKEKIQQRIDAGELTVDKMKPWEKIVYGAKAPKEKKPEYSLKEVTEFMEENTYFADEEGESDITVLSPEFANAAKDMLSKSDVADEYEIVEIESEIPAKKPWFGVNTPAEKVKTYKIQKKAAKPSAQMRKAGETITDYLKRIGR